MTATEPIEITTESGRREQRWPFPTDEKSLLSLVHILFEEHWDDIWFGNFAEGAAWEVAAPNAPERISMFDGYVTVDFGRWHFHLCIGQHEASGPDLGRIRRCSRAEMYRTLDTDGAPSSWGLRLFNGRDDQLMTAMLPNPFLTNRQKLRDEPDWSQLELWDRLREEFLGIGPDTADRQGKGFGQRAE